MSIKYNNGKDRQSHMDIDAYNKWCKEFNVGSHYVKPTEYYRTEHHYEKEESSDSLIGTISRLFKRILHAM